MKRSPMRSDVVVSWNRVGAVPSPSIKLYGKTECMYNIRIVAAYVSSILHGALSGLSAKKEYRLVNPKRVIIALVMHVNILIDK